jgi:hypothetical protein
MYLLLSSNRFYLLLLILSLMCGCKKISSLTNNPSGGGTDTSLGPPAVTAVGTPVGTEITKTIGPGGGTITSDDGKIDLTIPAGALSANTNISIQSVTNECPGAIGLAYDLLPNGTRFTVPASLTFHYTDSVVNGTDPLLLYNVFQDSLNQWEVSDEDKDVDTVAKTVSFDVSHFTIFATEPGVQVFSSRYQFNANETAALEVHRWVKSKNGSGTRLIPSSPYTNSQVSNWAVNGAVGGNSQDGTITGSGSGTGSRLADLVTYTAPSIIDQNRNIQVSVQLAEPETIYLRKGKKITFQNHTYTLLLKLIGNITFDIDIYLTQTGLSDIYPDVYHDEAKMVVNVKNDIVDVPTANIVNQKPTVTPTSWGDQGTGPGYTWVPDASGFINIQSGTGFVGDLGNGIKQIAITLTSGTTINPQYTVHDPALGTYSFGGNASAPWPPDLVLILKDSFQLYEIKQGWGYSVTPKH